MSNSRPTARDGGSATIAGAIRGRLLRCAAMVIDLLTFLENNDVSVFIREFPSVFGFPTILFLHTLGLAMVAGVSIAIDLWILRGATAGAPSSSGVTTSATRGSCWSIPTGVRESPTSRTARAACRCARRSSRG